jgi:pimeloyl-ACP methyl ester carboxylesterase
VLAWTWVYGVPPSFCHAVRMAARRRWGWSVGAVVLAIAGLGLAQAPVAGATQLPGNARASHAIDVSRGDFAGLVEIQAGRRLYLECRGKGSPTVVLEAGGGDTSDVWSLRLPDSHQTPVMSAVARYTRVCAYDRPGTVTPSGQPSRSDPVPLPRPLSQMVGDLHALLGAAHVPGPYVLVGHSMGGLLSRLYAGTYPDDVAGFVSVDAAHEIFYEAFEALLTPEQYQVPGLEIDIVATATAMRQARVQQPLRPMPMIVLEHSRDAKRFPNPFSFPTTYPLAALERAFQAAQDDLTALVPDARHRIAQHSGHNIHVEQPALVNRSIRQVVSAARAATRR